MIAIISKQYERDFLDLCKQLDLMPMETDRVRDKIMYEVYGEPEDLFLAGMGVGIEIGEERMWNAMLKRNDN